MNANKLRNVAIKKEIIGQLKEMAILLGCHDVVSYAVEGFGMTLKMEGSKHCENCLCRFVQ